MDSDKQDTKIERVVGLLARIGNIFGMIALVLMMLMTVADVGLRYFFNSPIVGGTEITEYLMVCLFLCVPWCTFTGGIVRMDLIVGNISQRGRSILDATTDLIGLVAMACLTWQLVVEMEFNRDVGIGSVVLKIPAYPFYAILALAVGLLCLVLITTIVRNLVRGIRA